MLTHVFILKEEGFCVCVSMGWWRMFLQSKGSVSVHYTKIDNFVLKSNWLCQNKNDNKRQILAYF